MMPAALTVRLREQAGDLVRRVLKAQKRRQGKAARAHHDKAKTVEGRTPVRLAFIV
jgi:hypothetical protein